MRILLSEKITLLTGTKTLFVIIDTTGKIAIPSCSTTYNFLPIPRKVSKNIGK